MSWQKLPWAVGLLVSVGSDLVGTLVVYELILLREDELPCSSGDLRTELGPSGTYLSQFQQMLEEST